MANVTRTFALRILKASWGIAIDLAADAQRRAEPPEGALPAGDRVWLDVSHVALGPRDIEQLRLGLSRVSPMIASRDPGHHVLVQIDDVRYTPTDYQPEGMAAAIIGWATEEFDLPQPDLEVRFNRDENRYVFEW